ncbi:MAG: HD domain-containing protein [Armatimonadetes bacterium]|nr:HD domain-containing protein [Armatimonadota bacterium]
MTITDQIVDLLENHGGDLYFGEQVTEKEHALQAAYFAEKDGAKPELVAAALLHDIGHLLHGLGEDVAEQGIDGKHEDVGAEWLDGHFAPEIVDCVRLHVDSKRYLTATEPGYLEGLSEASLKSLELQGGPFTADEVKAFEAAEPHFQVALQVRRWDDQAKVVGLEVPGVEHYRMLLESLAIQK